MLYRCYCWIGLLDNYRNESFPLWQEGDSDLNSLYFTSYKNTSVPFFE